jgi:hypothetical protein
MLSFDKTNVFNEMNKSKIPHLVNEINSKCYSTSFNFIIEMEINQKNFYK